MFAQANEPAGVVSLSANATADVTQDLMTLTMATTREADDAKIVQAALHQDLEAALATARQAVRPGHLEVHTGNFSLYPRHTQAGAIAGWQGRAEMIVEGDDMPAIGQLAGRIDTLSVAGVAYGLSRQLRERQETDVAAQAIAAFRVKAGDYARQFGYAGYTIREVNVNASEPPRGPVPFLRAKAMSAPDTSVPVEAGTASVAVTVSGSVQMTR